MKQLLPLVLTGLLVLDAQSQTPATGDPFVKGPEAKAESKPETRPPTLLLVSEIYALPRATAVQLLSAESGGAACYRKVSDWQKAGTARLVSLNAIASSSGQRCALESFDEVRYLVASPKTAAEPAAKEASGTTVPVAENPRAPYYYEMRNVGEATAIEATVSPDGRTVDVNLIPEQSALHGFRAIPNPPNAAVPASAWPVFSSQKISTSYGLTMGTPGLLGTMSPVSAAEGAPEVWLLFVRALPLPKVNPGETKSVMPPDTGGVRLEYSAYSCPRADALELLSAWPEVETPWKKVQALVESKKARCEQFVSMFTRPGQRTATQGLEELPVPPVEDRISTGLSIEVEPVLSNDGDTVDLNHVVSLVGDRGPLQYTGIPKSTTGAPVLESRKIQSGGNFAVGKQMLVGTLNPPPADGVNGRTDEGRTWLLFVRCQPGQP